MKFVVQSSPAKAGAESDGDADPGLRSLRSLTRGYFLSSLRDGFLLLVTCHLSLALLLFRISGIH